MKALLDLSLYLIVGPSHDTGDRISLVQSAVAGGVSLVQLRDKTSSTREMIAQARALKQALAGSGVPHAFNAATRFSTDTKAKSRRGQTHATANSVDARR